MNSVNYAGLFLVKTIFNLYIFLMMMRIILQWVGASTGNPLVQLIARLTNPPLKIFRRIFPVIAGFDIAAILLLLILEWAKIILLALLITQTFPHVLGLVVLAFGELLDLLVNIFLYGILIFVLLSWLAPVMQSPLMLLLYQVTEPLMRPIRRIMPPIAGIDLSPIPVMIILKVLQILVTQPLLFIGMEMAMRSV